VRSFLPARYVDLPEIGRLTGRGEAVNLENDVRLVPDLVLDVGSTTANYVSLADQVQEQTYIPTVLIGGRLAETPTTLRTIGDLLGASSRAEALAGHAEAVLSRVQGAIAKIPAAERPSVYVARGPTGLQTAVAGSIASEVVDLLGARNVVGKDTAPRTIVEVSPEQLLAGSPCDPHDRRRFHAAITDPAWQSLRRASRPPHFVPDLPFSGRRSPRNRLIGS
jgi:iron complex transport system substrate-binding protein